MANEKSVPRKQESIRRRLTLLITCICLLALVLLSGFLIIHDHISFKNNMVKNYETFAKIIAENSTAALKFEDKLVAQSVLSTLITDPHITQGVIYDAKGNKFAGFHNPNFTEIVTLSPLFGNDHRFGDNRLDLATGINLDGARIGRLHIQADLDELNSRTKNLLSVAIGSLIILFVVVTLLTEFSLRRIIAPISSLAGTARRVSKKRDYSLRAIKYTNDEVGELTQCFNEMLSTIQASDSALQNAHSKVEKQAEELTLELQNRDVMEKELHKSEEKFRDLFNNAPDIYIILDPESRIVDVNQRGLKRLGYTSKELVGCLITDIMHQEDMVEAQKVMRKVVAGRPPKNMEARLISKNGNIRWVIKEFSLLKDEQEQILNIRVICRDITARKRLQEELGRAHRLETAGRIAGQIAHDFNNLLGPLAAYPAMIRDDLPKGHAVVEMVDEIEEAAEKIADINQQLLSLGRRGHYSVEPLDLNTLLNGVMMKLNKQGDSKNVIKKQFSHDLFKVTGGAAQLSRALSNLINNAVESMHGSGGKLTVSTQNIYLDKPLNGYKSITPGEYVKLEIADSGCGIPNEIINKIFDPFFTTKTMDKMRGSGLGLSVVHGVIEDHGGYVTVSSKINKGTVFTIYFPVARDVQPAGSQLPGELRGGDESILIVDDDSTQRKVTTQLLKRLGYKIDSVASGELAVEYVKINKPDLLVLDMVMDGIDGAETYRRVLKERPGQKAIILSGYAMSRLVKLALNLGAGMFISKPISLDTLAHAVRTELDKPDHKPPSDSRVRMGRLGHANLFRNNNSIK